MLQGNTLNFAPKYPSTRPKGPKSPKTPKSFTRRIPVQFGEADPQDYSAATLTTRRLPSRAGISNTTPVHHTSYQYSGVTSSHPAAPTRHTRTFRTRQVTTTPISSRQRPKSLVCLVHQDRPINNEGRSRAVL